MKQTQLINSENVQSTSLQVTPTNRPKTFSLLNVVWMDDEQQKNLNMNLKVLVDWFLIDRLFQQCFKNPFYLSDNRLNLAASLQVVTNWIPLASLSPSQRVEPKAVARNSQRWQQMLSSTLVPGWNISTIIGCTDMKLVPDICVPPTCHLAPPSGQKFLKDPALSSMTKHFQKLMTLPSATVVLMFELTT